MTGWQDWDMLWDSGTGMVHTYKSGHRDYCLRVATLSTGVTLTYFSGPNETHFIHIEFPGRKNRPVALIKEAFCLE